MEVSSPIRCRNSKANPDSRLPQVPTFDLGISNLFPRLRHDERFLTSFFLIRIAFNLVLLLDCIRPSSRHMFHVAWMPPTMLSLALTLHVLWFKAGLAGYLKRRSAATATAAAASDNAVEQLSELDSAKRTEAGSTDSPLETPEDTPLITPHTPTTGPISVRDSSFFPHFPALPHLPNMPNLGHLPTVSIPNLPTLAELSNVLQAHRDNVNFGFKDAVKTRIVEQRERFAGLTGGRGITINFPSLSGMSMGRRASTTDDRTGVQSKPQDLNGLDVEVANIQDEASTI